MTDKVSITSFAAAANGYFLGQGWAAVLLQLGQNGTAPGIVLPCLYQRKAVVLVAGLVLGGGEGVNLLQADRADIGWGIAAGGYGNVATAGAGIIPFYCRRGGLGRGAVYLGQIDVLWFSHKLSFQSKRWAKPAAVPPRPIRRCSSWPSTRVTPSWAASCTACGVKLLVVTTTAALAPQMLMPE